MPDARERDGRAMMTLSVMAKEQLKRYITVECERCGAGVGEWCVAASGREASWPHRVRRDEVNRASGRR